MRARRRRDRRGRGRRPRLRHQRLPTGVGAPDRGGDDHHARRRRHLLQHGRLPDVRLPRRRPRDLPLRGVRRRLRRDVRAVAADRGGPRRCRVPPVPPVPGARRAGREAADGRPHPAGPARPGDRPADRRRRVRPAGVEHRARPLTSRMDPQRVGQHETGGDVLRSDRLEQRVGGLRRLPGPARRRLAPRTAPAARPGARERRRPRLLRDRPSRRPRRPLRVRGGPGALRVPRGEPGCVPRPPVVRPGCAGHRLLLGMPRSSAGGSGSSSSTTSCSTSSTSTR